MRKYLYQYTNQENAYIVENYPWGFRLRTTIRYWIETKQAKNGGQRFGSQTVNPKTGKWCAPKYSTYSPLMVMYLDENNHVKIEALNMYSSLENVLEFKNNHLANLSDFQKESLREMIGYNEAMKHVKVEIKPRPFINLNDPIQVSKREEEEREQEEAKKKINRLINIKIQQVVL